MSRNKWWSTKVGVELLSDLFIFLIISFDIPLDFHKSIRVVSLKCLMHFFLAGIAIKFWNIPREKYFALWRILNLFIKSFVNHFVGIALTFSESSFNSFLFDVTSYILLTKCVFFTRLAT